MKITFLLPHINIAGGTRAALIYANLLTGRGHEVKVVVPISSFIKRQAARLIKRKPNWISDFMAKIVWVPEYKEQFVPSADIIVATAWQTAGPVASFSENKGKKIYFIQHYESLYHGPKEKVDPTYKLPLKKIVISGWLKDIMKNNFNQDAEIIVTPVDEKQFRFIESARGHRPIRVLMLHHTAKWKGVEKGTEAFQLAKKTYPDIKLVLFGARRKRPESFFDEYHFNPNQNSLAEIYSSCHIYLCPSEFEGLGMPSMEAMACRSALDTFDTGGSMDYAIDGETALVAKQNDVEDLADKLRKLIGDDNLREKLALAGQRYITSNFLWAKAVEKMEDIFKNA